MTDVQSIEERATGRLRGRDRRALNLSTKLTAAEAKTIEHAALGAGLTPSEWARDVLLREVRGSGSSPIGSTVLTELVGLHLFLINVLSPIARGERISQEYFQEILRHVREHKDGAAAEILGAAYSAPVEEQR